MSKHVNRNVNGCEAVAAMYFIIKRPPVISVMSRIVTSC